MSGGRFDFKQHIVKDLIEDMKDILNQLDREPVEVEIGKEDIDETISLRPYIKEKEKFKKEIEKNIELLQTSSIYMERLDRFLNGDESEEDFYKNIKENMLNKEESNNHII